MSEVFIKMLKKEKSRKGFTLIEVLIVIAIIGILTAGMTLAAGGSRDAAEATRIIADLRTIKTAALMWVASEAVTDDDWLELVGDDQNTLNSLNKYLDRPLISRENNFEFGFAAYKEEEGKDVIRGGEAWLLGYNLSDVRDGVKKKLAEQAKDAGLFAGDEKGISGNTWPPSSYEFYSINENDGYVWVVVQ